MNDTLFKKLYNNLYNLHPEESNNPKLKYVNRSWFFPNHLDITLDCIKNCVKKYNQGANLEIALYGGLFHDAGLVYKRESASPEGHESRSIEYAKNELEKSGYKKEFIELVIECILSTEPDYIPKLEEAIIVRSCDTYSHIKSIHYFAKANFALSIQEFISWFDKKIEKDFNKIMIPQMQNEVEPIINVYKGMINLYYLNNKIA